jgi:hypothetical protein
MIANESKIVTTTRIYYSKCMCTPKIKIIKEGSEESMNHLLPVNF